MFYQDHAETKIKSISIDQDDISKEIQSKVNDQKQKSLSSKLNDSLLFKNNSLSNSVNAQDISLPNLSNETTLNPNSTRYINKAIDDEINELVNQSFNISTIPSFFKESS